MRRCLMIPLLSSSETKRCTRFGACKLQQRGSASANGSRAARSGVLARHLTRARVCGGWFRCRDSPSTLTAQQRGAARMLHIANEAILACRLSSVQGRAGPSGGSRSLAGLGFGPPPHISHSRLSSLDSCSREVFRMLKLHPVSRSFKVSGGRDHGRQRDAGTRRERRWAKGRPGWVSACVARGPVDDSGCDGLRT